MRLVTKALLILSLVVLCVAVLWYSGRDEDLPRDPYSPVNGKAAGEKPAFDDPLAGLEKVRQHLTQFARRSQSRGTGEAEEAAGPEEGSVRAPATQRPRVGRPARFRRDPHDLESTAMDEGIALARPAAEVLGADPPGPVLRPAGLRGRVVTRPLVEEKREPEPAGRTHEVAPGDTLYDIAIQYYGGPSYVEYILAANPGVDPDALQVGERLRLPEREQAPAAAPKPKKPEPKIYVVRPNDTLIRIAHRFYGDTSMYLRIYQANRDRLSSPNDTLYVGQRLRLPDPPG
jgi:nucleoid-associated protein YgaU